MQLTSVSTISPVGHFETASSQLRVVPPLETAILDSVFPLAPLQNFGLPLRQLASLDRSTAQARVSPPGEGEAVHSALPTQPTLRPTSAVKPAADPNEVVVAASVAAPAHEGLPTPGLHATALGNPLKVEWALEVVKGISLSHAAAQMALTQARLRTLQASRQPVDPVTPIVSATLTAEQVQALPLAGRKWQNFVLDTPTSSAHSAGAAPSANDANPVETTIDGVSTRLAFGSPPGSVSGSADSGSTGSGSLDRSQTAGMALPWATGHGLQVAETAIREVQSAAGNAEVESARAGGGQVSVTTQQGGPGFHGQTFLFDRQNTWGARNPFTSWVQQTAPATATTVPVFGNGPNGAPESYTPPDHEAVWGIGLGGQIRRGKLFWFAALDSYHRNDPGVAMVKHPYLQDLLSNCVITSENPCAKPTGFFAQPTNDEAQVLAAGRLGKRGSRRPANPVVEGLAAYSTMLETLAGLLGPAPRTASQWVGFARLDWQAAERHRITLEGIGALWNSPGGGLTRVSETYGNHSFGTSVASEEMLMARWEAFLTPNLMAVTQASVGRNILEARPSTPSTFEQAFLAGNAYSQLPQIGVDNRYGFTIGNPSRFGQGSYPDEHSLQGQESVNWVRASLLVKAGFELAHDADATSLLRNQTGTYTYSNVENFASDALAFASYGLQDPNLVDIQHGCDQTGTVWRDSGGGLRGLGSLPCYSYFSQIIGPPGWQVSTNDWAGFATTQWQPAKRIVVSAGLRWEREQLPPPIATLNNPDLPLTEKTPSLGNDWGPRVSMAIGSGESHWPVFRLGYGMYFARTPNQLIETALTQTGSFNGDLSFFMRPADDCQFCADGAPAFPYVLRGAPGTVVKPGAVQFAPRFHNPEIHQAVAAVEKALPGHVQVTASALLSLGRRLPVPIDANIDPTPLGTITYAVEDATGAGPIKTPRITVPLYASWPSSTESTGDCPPTPTVGWLNPCYQQINQITSKANSTYEAAELKVVRYGHRGLSLHAHYTYSHAMDWNPNQTPLIGGPSVFDPANFRQEYGVSDLDVRHSAAVIAAYETPWKLRDLAGKLGNGWMLSGIGQFRSGLPYTMHVSGSMPECVVTTGITSCTPQGPGVSASVGDYIVGLRPGMNGSGGDNRVYGVGEDGLTYNIGRNTYRYPATWKADLRVGKSFDLGQMRRLELMVESFNLFNHQNVTEIETTGYYMESGTASSPPTLNFLGGPFVEANGTTKNPNATAFGQPLNINATDLYRERQIQVGMRLRF